jgi:hypothetical protein
MTWRFPVLTWKFIMAVTIGITYLPCCGCREQPPQKSPAPPVSIHGYPMTKTALGGLSGSDAADWKTTYPIHRVKPDHAICYPILRVKPDPDVDYR